MRVVRADRSRGADAVGTRRGAARPPVSPWPIAPPCLKAGKLIIGQTANILLYLGPRHDLAPADEAGGLLAHQLQLTITDLVVEMHDTHHPLTTYLFFRGANRSRAATYGRFLGISRPAATSSAARSVMWISRCSRSSKACVTPFPNV